MAFPVSPANGQVYTSEAGVTYSWSSADGTWIIATPASSTADGNTLTGAVDPVSGDGINGDYWINKVSKVLFGPKAGGIWPGVGTSLGGGTGSVSHGTVFPSSPVEGSWFYHTASEVLYVYLSDGTTGAWVDISTSLSGAGGSTVTSMYNARTFSGTANSLVALCVPTAPLNLVPGDIVIGTISVTNTSTVVATLDTGATYNVVRGDGSTVLAAGDLVSGHTIIFRYDGSSLRAMTDLTTNSSVGSGAGGMRVLAAFPSCTVATLTALSYAYNIASASVPNYYSNVTYTFTNPLPNNTYSVITIPATYGSIGSASSVTIATPTNLIKSTTGLVMTGVQYAYNYSGNDPTPSITPLLPGFIILG